MYITHDEKASVWSNNYTFNYPCSLATTCSPYRVLAKPGIYLLEVWGASGGSPTDDTRAPGGYSYGLINLDKTTILYVRVGGKGSMATSQTKRTMGGYNGGGDAINSLDSEFGTGGGASDIRIKNDDELSIVIAAGGGGGYGQIQASYESVKYTNLGGYGGGFFGNDGTANCKQNYEGKGGTRTPTTKVSTYKWAGGGGGWDSGDYSDGYGASGGGGSGFIFDSFQYTPSNFKLDKKYFIKQGNSFNMTVGFPSPNGSTEYGHYGNGASKITFILPYIVSCAYKRSSSIMKFSLLMNVLISIS